MSIGALLIGLAPSLLILLTLSGLLSAAETSMTAASRGRLHQLEREGDRAALVRRDHVPLLRRVVGDVRAEVLEERVRHAREERHAARERALRLMRL